MDFSVSTLAAGFIYGILGMWLIRQGRRTAHIPWFVIGLVLIIYPYFVENVFLLWGIGAALLVVAARMD
jgi:hypothetical protein